MHLCVSTANRSMSIHEAFTVRTCKRKACLWNYENNKPSQGCPILAALTIKKLQGLLMPRHLQVWIEQLNVKRKRCRMPGHHFNLGQCRNWECCEPWGVKCGNRGLGAWQAICCHYWCASRQCSWVKTPNGRKTWGWIDTGNGFEVVNKLPENDLVHFNRGEPAPVQPVWAVLILKVNFHKVGSCWFIFLMQQKLQFVLPISLNLFLWNTMGKRHFQWFFFPLNWQVANNIIKHKQNLMNKDTQKYRWQRNKGTERFVDKSKTKNT